MVDFSIRGMNVSRRVRVTQGNAHRDFMGGRQIETLADQVRVKGQLGFDAGSQPLPVGRQTYSVGDGPHIKHAIGLGEVRMENDINDDRATEPPRHFHHMR